MFVTTAAMRSMLVSSVFSDAEVWELVEVELAVPLVLITVTNPVEEIDIPVGVRRTFLGMARHLKDFFGSAQVVRADLFMPAHLNGTTGWSLEQLDEVWRCTEPGSQRSAWVYRVRGDQEYADSALGTRAELLSKTECIFRADR